MNQTVVGRITLGCSVAFHAWIFSGEAAATIARPTPHSVQAVEFVVAQLEPPKEIHEPLPEPQAPEPTLAPKPRYAEPDASEVQDPLGAEALPPELTGATLSAEDGVDFGAQQGSGRARRGAFRSGVSRAVDVTPNPLPKRQAPALSSAEPSFVPVSQLSRLPNPPNLAELLQRNYPSAARRQGQSGEAKVRARIGPNGRVEQAKVIFETSDGFGRACHNTLIGSHWSSPRDAKGKRVATWVNYRCKFRIEG